MRLSGRAVTHHPDLFGATTTPKARGKAKALPKAQPATVAAPAPAQPRQVSNREPSARQKRERKVGIRFAADPCSVCDGRAVEVWTDGVWAKACLTPGCRKFGGNGE